MTETIHDRVAARKADLDATKREQESLEALATLIRNNGIGPGPVKSVYAEPVAEVLVGIGRDNTATVRLFADDVTALEEQLGIKLTEDA